MKLYIASDHAGIELKKYLTTQTSLTQKDGTCLGLEWVDLGPEAKNSVDYPSFAQDLVNKILSEFPKNAPELLEPRGVLICGSGVGMSMAANRFKGIRAVLADRADVAKRSREHNASNVLCMGERVVSQAEALEILREWAGTSFAGDRHARRVWQMDE